MRLIEWVKHKTSYRGDHDYKESINNYTIKDGILAVLIFPAYVFFTYLGIQIQIHTGSNIIALVTNTAVVLLVFIIIRLRKQNLYTVGISTDGWFKSSIVGFVIGMTFFMLRVMGVIPAAFQAMGEQSVAFIIFYYFVVISFSEEFMFRGYMQTRIYGIIKSSFWAVVVVGFLFALLHIIIDIMFMRYFGSYARYTPRVWSLIQLTIIHVLINYLYRRYNSLVGPVILHGFLNLP